jgi:serine phosphatase RsbU (regulator of sigma subunit)
MERPGELAQHSHKTGIDSGPYSRRMKSDDGRAALNYWMESRGRDGMPASGDFSDCIEIAAGRYAFVTGELAGRGSGIREAARRLRWYSATVATSGIALTTGMRAVDVFFTRSLRRETIPFASVFIAVADLQSGVLRYASAGHETALLFAPDRSHEELGPTGSRLGADGEGERGERALRLFDESLLVVVTDGITASARRAADRVELFGSSGVVAAIRAALTKRDDPARAVSLAALRHANGKLTDDASVLVSQLRPSSAFAPNLRALLDVS